MATKTGLARARQPSRADISGRPQPERVAERSAGGRTMTSLLVHAALGVLMIALLFQTNAHLYRGDWQGSRATLVERLYYVLAVVSLCLGWYFNQKYVFAYPADASWAHFTRMLFANPAAGSGGQDLIVTNAVLFPLWTMIDGPRRGLRRCWIYFVMSLFTSFGFAMGMYLAAQERQVRWLARARSRADASVPPPHLS